MARANRHYIPSLVWHITHRCHKKEFLLRFAKDRQQWLRWLFEAKKRFGIRILNYTVTSNHIHLHVQDDAGREVVPKTMQLIAGRTGQEYNRRKNRKGAFWEDRYHATAVQDDDYLIQFIRYKIGDMGVPSNRKCKCGRGLPLMEKVEGRVFNVVRTPSGQALGGTFWTLLSRAVEGIRQFQVIQREIDKITFKIVVDDTFRSESFEYLQKKISEHCGRDFKVDFRIVDNIPLTKSGKRRFVISQL